MADKLTEDDLAAGLKGSLWEGDTAGVSRDWTFADFKEAMTFVNRVAELAEEANHHPDILVHGWNKVRLTFSTHSAGGVTQADLDMTRRVDDL